MQVSWIDPDEIAKLAAQLDGPLQRDEASPWDLETLPDLSKLFAPEEKVDPVAAQLADAMAAPAPGAMEQEGSVPPPEVDHIREKLRAIRSRALDSGLLPPKGIPAVVPEISAPPQPAPPEQLPAFDEPMETQSPNHLPPSPVPSLATPEIPIEVPVPAISTSVGPEFPAHGSITERLEVFINWARSQAPCEDILLVDDHGDLLWGGSARADLALSVVLSAGAGLRSGSDALTRSSVFIRSRLGEKKELSVLPCPTRHGMVTLALLNADTLANDTAAVLRDTLVRCVDESAVTPAEERPAAQA